MGNANYNVFFKGRRPLDQANKRFYKMLGTAEIGLGSICLLFSIGKEFAVFYLALLFVGIFSIVYAMIGKYWMTEKNYIIINPKAIEFKNLSQKPTFVPRDTLQDVMIESNKVVFLSSDQPFKLYDFSIFKEKELKEINVELLKIKLEVNKKPK